jgi:hypothetical protein
MFKTRTKIEAIIAVSLLISISIGTVWGVTTLKDPVGMIL